MYKGVSAAYTVIVLSYWLLAFCGYWAFGSEVQPYIVSSLSDPKWTIIMANLFAVIQISGCFQVTRERERRRQTIEKKFESQYHKTSPTFCAKRAIFRSKSNVILFTT